MSGYQGFDESSSMYNNLEGLKNKYIYFKQDNSAIPKSSTILVNPHFRDNTKVFINPKFAKKPNIHVNPNKINQNFQISEPQNSVSTNESSILTCNNRLPLKSIPTDDRGRVLVSTKNKLIKVPQNKKVEECVNFKSESNIAIKVNNNMNERQKKFNCISSSRFKKVNKISPVDIVSVKKRNIVTPRSKIINNSPYSVKKTSTNFRRSCSNSKFKYVKSPIIAKKTFIRNIIKTKHKIVNKLSSPNNSVSNTNVQFLPNMSISSSPLNRKKYIFVNKYNSSSFVANNVIFKNAKWKNLISINGILYRNSPSFLKKAQLSPNKSSNPINTSKINVKLSPTKTRRKSSIGSLKSQSQYKLIRRTSLPALTKLKKCNISCSIYKKFGKCKGQKNGTCIRIHNPDQIIVCTKFLQGACIKQNCLLSHKVSPEKMPTCKYYLEGLCSRDECPYLHVKISPKAHICRDFLEGFCKAGIECDKRHQFLCPEFERTQKCSKRKCEYPHMNQTKATVKYKKNYKNTNKRKQPRIMTSEQEEKPKIRYYEENDNEKKVGETLISSRPKLGSLPSFIPFNEENSEKM